MFYLSIATVLAFGLMAVTTASISREEITAYSNHFREVMNTHFVSNPDLMNAMLFTPDATMEFHMFGERMVGNYDQVMKPFGQLGKSFTLVNKIKAIGDDFLAVDFASSQTTVTDCTWTCTGIGLAELTRNAAGEVRATKHILYADNENCQSLKKCMDGMKQNKDL